LFRPLPVAPLERVGRRLVSWRLLRLAAPAYLALMLIVWAVLLNLWLGGARGFDRYGVVLGPDFPAFYTGGWLVRHGERSLLYDLERQQAVQQLTLPGSALSAYVNPPHYSLFAAPFSALSYPAAFALWSLLMLAAFVASLLLLRPLLPTLQVRRGWLLATLALLSAPVYYALSAGQNTGLSLLLHSAIVLALTRRRAVLAGLLIALGMFKPQLFVGLLPLLALGLPNRQRWRLLLSFALSAGLLGLLTLGLFGLDTLMQWQALLRSPLYQAEELRQAAKMFSWQPFWALLLGANAVSAALGWGSALLTFVGLCALWRRADQDLPLRYAITLCGLLLIGPHLPVYDLALLILPALIIADRVLHAPPERWLLLRVLLLALYVSVLFSDQVRTTHVQIVAPLMAAVALLAVPLLRAPAALPKAVRSETSASGAV
jgi:hypothetical protein